ncbi:MAG: hypothetical protein JSS12_00320 [Verrucomicrobia bacterium]|nr:hypothetical protein [Verrucomicrobiota bacterium]
MNTITDGLGALRIGRPQLPVLQHAAPQPPATFDLNPTDEMRSNVASFLNGELGILIDNIRNYLQSPPPLLVGDEVNRLIGWDFLSKNYVGELSPEWITFMRQECQKPITNITIRFFVNSHNRRDLVEKLAAHFQLGNVTHIDAETANLSICRVKNVHFTFCSKVVPFVLSHEAMQIELSAPVRLIDHGMGRTWCQDTMQKTLRVAYPGPRQEKLLLRSLRSGYVAPVNIPLPTSCFDPNENICLQNALFLRTVEGAPYVTEPTKSFWHTCVSLVQTKQMTFIQLEEQLQLVAMACSIFETQGPLDIFCSAPSGVPTYFFRCDDCILRLPCQEPKAPLHPAMEPLVTALFSDLTIRRESPVLKRLALNWQAVDRTTEILLCCIVPDFFGKAIERLTVEPSILERTLLRAACNAQGLHLNGESWLSFLLHSNHPQYVQIGLRQLCQTDGNVELKLRYITQATPDIALKLISQVENDPLCTQEHVLGWLTRCKMPELICQELVSSKKHRWLKTAVTALPNQLELYYKDSHLRTKLFEAYLDGDTSYNAILVPHVVCTEAISHPLWPKLIGVTTAENQSHIQSHLEPFLALRSEATLRFLRLYKGSLTDVQRAKILDCVRMPLPEDAVRCFLSLVGTSRLPITYEPARQAALARDIKQHHPQLITAEYEQALSRELAKIEEGRFLSLLAAGDTEAFERLVQTKGQIALKLQWIPKATHAIALRLISQVENDLLCTEKHVREWLRAHPELFSHLSKGKWVKTVVATCSNQLEDRFTDHEICTRLLEVYLEGDVAYNALLVPYVVRPATANHPLWAQAMDATVVTKQKHIQTQLQPFLELGGEPALRFMRLYRGQITDAQRGRLLDAVVMPLPRDVVEIYLTLAGSEMVPYKYQPARQLAIAQEIKKAYPDAVSQEYEQELRKRIPRPAAEKKKKAAPIVAPVAAPRQKTTAEIIQELLAKGDPKKQVCMLLEKNGSIGLWKQAFRTFDANLQTDHITDGIMRLPCTPEYKPVWDLILKNSQWLNDAKTMYVYDRLHQIYEKIPGQCRDILLPLIGHLKEQPQYIPTAYRLFKDFPFDREIALQLLQYCPIEVLSDANDIVTKLLPVIGKEHQKLVPFCKAAVNFPNADRNVLAVALVVPSVCHELLERSLSLESLTTLFERRGKADKERYNRAYPRLAVLACESRNLGYVQRVCVIDFGIPTHIAQEERFRLKLRCIQYRGWDDNMKTLFAKSLEQQPGCQPTINWNSSYRHYGFSGTHQLHGSLSPVETGTNVPFIEKAIRTALELASEHKETPAYFHCMLNFAVQTVRNMLEAYPRIRFSFDPFSLLLALDQSEIMFGLLRMAKRKGVIMEYVPRAQACRKTFADLDSETAFTGHHCLREVTAENVVPTLLRVQREMCTWQDLHFIRDFEGRQKVLEDIFAVWKKFPLVVCHNEVIQSMSSVLLPNGVLDYYPSLESFLDCLASIYATACTSSEPPFHQVTRTVKNGIVKDYTDNGRIAAESLKRITKDFKTMYEAGIYNTYPQKFHEQARKIIQLFKAPSYLEPLSLVEPVQLFTETITEHEIVDWLLMLLNHRNVADFGMIYSAVLEPILRQPILERIVDPLLEIGLAIQSDSNAIAILERVLPFLKKDYTGRVPLFVDRAKRAMSLLFSQPNSQWASFIDVITHKVYDEMVQAALIVDWMKRLMTCSCPKDFFEVQRDRTMRAIVEKKLLQSFMHLDKDCQLTLLQFSDKWRAPKELMNSYVLQLKCVEAFLSIEVELAKQEK